MYKGADPSSQNGNPGLWWYAPQDLFPAQPRRIWTRESRIFRVPAANIIENGLRWLYDSQRCDQCRWAPCRQTAVASRASAPLAVKVNQAVVRALVTLIVLRSRSWSCKVACAVVK